jgi:hypothetical protein
MTGTSSTPGPGPIRRALAGSVLAASALPAFAERHLEPWAYVYVALLGVAAIGLSRRSIVAQVLSRGAAWLMFVPAVAYTVGASAAHTMEWQGPFIALTSGVALLLARPALHTAEAKAAFAPSAYRKTFLAGAVAAASVGTSAALLALESIHWRDSIGVPFAFFGAALLASAVGVARMRSWGVLLAMATFATTFFVSLFVGGPAAVAAAAAAVPSALLVAPLIAARLRKPAPAESLSAGAVGRARLGAEAFVEEREDALPPVLARVGIVAEGEGHELAEPVRLAVGEK